MLKLTLIAATVATGLASAPSAAYADDWGCEVLMCSMSNNPTWPGVPSCIAPMTRLINARNSAWLFNPFRWPTCEGANATVPQRSNYPECPEGSDSIALSDLSPGCINRTNQETVVLEQRERPWFFDIALDDGTTTRHWFSLAR